MPSVDNHIDLAADHLKAVRLLAVDPTVCRPMSVSAYYCAMHLVEAAYAEPATGLRVNHFHRHLDRITATQRDDVHFGQDVVLAFKALFNFSYIARYMSAVQFSRTTATGNFQTSTVSSIHSALPANTTNHRNILVRLEKVIDQVQVMLPAKQANFQFHGSIWCLQCFLAPHTVTSVKVVAGIQHTSAQVGAPLQPAPVLTSGNANIAASPNSLLPSVSNPSASGSSTTP